MDISLCQRCASKNSILDNAPPSPGTHPYWKCGECGYIWTEQTWNPAPKAIVDLREWAEHCGEEFDGEPSPYKCGIQAAKDTVLSLITWKDKP